MSTTTQVQKVKLNKMSKSRYEETTPVATEFYMLTDVLDSSYDELPTADVKYVGQITQYTGTTTSTLTNGYFYKCTAQGTVPETYAWEQTDVQPSGGGGSTKNVITLTGESGTLTSAQIAQVLDDTAVLEIVCDGQVFRLSNKDSTLTYRTYLNEDCALNENVAFKAIYVQLNSSAANYGAWSLEEVSAGGGSSYSAGTGIDITGGVISVADPTVINYATQNTSLELSKDYNQIFGNKFNSTVGVGKNTRVWSNYSVAIGYYASISNNSDFGLAVGYNTSVQAPGAIQIGCPTSQSLYVTNADADTFKVGNRNGNFEIMSANGTIPTARLTNVIADSSTTATDQTWSASKLNTMIGNIESLLANI